MRAALVLIAVLIAAAVGMAPEARSIWPRTEIVIGYDPGGNVGDYLRWYTRVAASGAVVHLNGACISACTLVLSLPPQDACIEPTAKLGFHLASVEGKDDPEATADLIATFYPAAVVKWIKDHGPLKSEPIYMTGKEAIELGVLRPCQ